MEQLHNGVRSSITLGVYLDGELVVADSGIVSVSVYNADDNSTTPTLIESGTASYDNVSGLYKYILKMSTVSLNRVLEVVWSYSLNGDSTSQTDYVQVVTPYASVSDVVEYYSLGTKPNEPDYKSEKEIVYAEQMARITIDRYVNQSFGKKYGTQEVFGIGSDAIQLLEKMLRIDKVYENDELVIDNTISPAYNSFGFPIELTPTGKVARVSGQMWDVRYDNQVDVTMLNYGKFRSNTRYAFTGVIGWDYVPQDIKLASLLLVGDFLSQDSAWRNKYLAKISMSEISFEMKSGAFNGTGNLLVDSILDAYRHVGIVII